jgi:Tectonin domain
MKSLVSAAAGFLCAVLATVFPDVARAQTWQLMPGAARDIAASSDGAVWAIGGKTTPGGFEILRWDGASHWITMPGGAVRIAADPNGNAWVANDAHVILRYDGRQWVGVNGRAATDIGIGADGTIWVIGADAAPGGYNIYRSTDAGEHWTQMPGAAERVAVDPRGNAWVVNSSHNIFSFDGRKFGLEPGAAVDVSVGADGAVWVTGVDGAIYRWTNGGWLKRSGGAVQISAGPAGVVWVVNAAGQIYKGTDEPAKSAAVASSQPATPGTIVITTPLPTVRAQTPQQGTVVTGTGAVTSVPLAVQVPAPSGVPSGVPGLVIGTGPNVGGASPPAPLVVTGLTPPFKPKNLVLGAYECPIFATAGAGSYVAAPCNEFSNTEGPATYLGKADNGGGCPPGFRDDGLYCAKPAAEGRGAGYGWQIGDKAFDSSGQWARCQHDNSQGCEQPGGGVTLVYPKCKQGYYAFGTNICSPSCPTGMTEIGVSCTKPPNCSSYGRVAGLGYAFGDPRNGGECWACPVLMQRTMFPVTNTDSNFPACNAGGIFWRSAQYPEPGLAAFITSPDIVQLAFVDPKLVDAFLSKRAGGDAGKKAKLWDQMIDAPNDSPELKALIYAAILTAAKNDPTLTATRAGSAVAFFQNYIQARRTYVAQDALSMYNKYKIYNAYEQSQGLQQAVAAGGSLGFVGAGAGGVISSGGSGLSAVLGAAPDDYVNAAYGAAVPDARGQAVIVALSDLANTTYTPAGNVSASDPNQAGALAQSATKTVVDAATSVKGVLDVLPELKVIDDIAALGGKVGFALDLGGSLVGEALDGVAAVLTLVAQEQAEAQYATLVSDAQQPVSVANIISTGSTNDQNTLMMWWALGTAAYQASSTVGQNPLTNSDVCAVYANNCAQIKAIVTGARPSP